MTSPLEDLSPGQIERLKELAALTPEQLETMKHVIQKEASWTFVRSSLRTTAIWIVSIVTAITLLWDQIKTLLGLSPPT